MPLRAIATELIDQHDIERARLIELLDDRNIAIERAQKAIRENRIEEIQIDPHAFVEISMIIGGLRALRQAIKLTHAKASNTTCEDQRSVLV